MKKNIGLVQTRGIGDIIIALPIADYYHKKGHTIHWPIDASFIHFIQDAAPHIEFIPVDYQPTGGPELYFIDAPLKLLKNKGITDIRVLYNKAGGKLLDEKLGGSLKFDEYKYAICQVPFSEKWNLHFNRNIAREKKLYDRLNISGKYVCVHR